MVDRGRAESSTTALPLIRHSRNGANDVSDIGCGWGNKVIPAQAGMTAWGSADLKAVTVILARAGIQ
ncbi:MAG: hypothetical protein OXD35_13530 [Thiotrichales bacterium]|nr:hypothetical protein [Thiotrichales bacterium]